MVDSIIIVIGMFCSALVVAVYRMDHGYAMSYIQRHTSNRLAARSKPQVYSYLFGFMCLSALIAIGLSTVHA